MSIEKEYLVKAIDSYLEGGDYFFLTDFSQVTVEETQSLRKQLDQQSAQFHVTKNRLLRHLVRERGLNSDVENCLKGPTAMVSGGANPSEVAKLLTAFQKDSSKLPFKGGILGEQFLSAEDIEALSKLPSLDALKAQLLSLLNTPASQMVRVMNAPAVGLLNVAKARSEQL